ncbi:hypothetical protein CGRA01v4_05588 [Colletotrichum graminicola]|uniref:SWI/SNF and RSC complexes subunit ssr4 n=1 Tax=Colletotrichum graminicola (strain M1.001 / M2 / FGSC 10212) TaxID=645133 RepID=E3Q6J3_COLGM|nr:uncharacterized protein GLRG_01585 [Colletotrichum graminicola M1.001]EFQ26441.1 hypothetical protein GLRG_01585 [Colletotrichum graminicola M1.001]WDK14307.1 hypothetical protein CGRA01v4_05588 [Colletotrichum graminicola]
MAQDPSDGIDQELLNHAHLISANHYADQARVDLNQVTKWLMAAPQVAKDKAPFFWTYLDRPRDGQVYLTWQPLKRLGTNFASDGMIWGPEQYHRQDVGNGLSLEIHYVKSGFVPGEQVAMHARRRFRLVPSQTGVMNAPQPDISLWIVHYGPSDPPDRVPVNLIPVSQETQHIMATRNHLQKCGQIARKDFMLSDRASWPQIQFPRNGGRPQMYNPPAQSRRIPQQMAYPPTGPQGRRGRQQAQAQAQAQQHQQALAHAEALHDDEELEKDLFDHLTPRDISFARYQQNHEWMEEIVSSPYGLSQIVPPDLGLGLKGELASLTDGIFPAQSADALTEPPQKPYIGRLEPGLADEFRKRVREHLDATKAEMEKMKAEHAKNLASLKASSVFVDAEKDIKNSVQEHGPEPWRIEGHYTDSEDNSGPWSQKHNKKVDEIVAQVEANLGRQIEVLHNVHRIQDGGFQEPAPEPVKEPSPVPPPASSLPPAAGADTGALGSRRPSQAGSTHSGVMVGDSDIDMGGTAAGLLDEMHTGFSANSTPLNNFPTPQTHMSALNSTAGTPANANAPSPAPVPPTIPEETETQASAGASAGAAEDVTMGNTGSTKNTPATAPDHGTGSGEWVVVPKGGTSPDPGAGAATSTGATEGDEPKAAAKIPSAAGTPVETQTPGGFSSLGDLDSAGDAMASYGASMADGLDMNMEMEDSAFGDAFHGVSSTNTPGNQSEGGA